MSNELNRFSLEDDCHPHLLQLLRIASPIAVLTGAGVSAESGILTFRDAMTGLWANFDPADLATPEAFAKDPATVSRWYDERRCKIAKCQPNAGHFALAKLQAVTIADRRSFALITQNVDRLHQAAGSKDVVELHGTLWLWRCLDCGIEYEERGAAFSSYPLRCACGGSKRPGVVWFGEDLPKHALLTARRAAGSSALFVSIGTSGAVHPAAGLIDVAIQSGARFLEINPQETPYTSKAHWSLRGKSGEILPQLLELAGAE